VKFLDEVKGREDVDYFNIPEPKWHDCFFKTGDSKSGQVLCSFNIVSVDYVFQHHLCKPDCLPKCSQKTNLVENFVSFEEQSVCINVLGLRGLKSSGILPIKKARIEFGMKSLIEPGSSRDL